MKSEVNHLTLTLVVPVLPGVTSVAARPRALELLLTRAHRTPADTDIDRLLCQLFDVTLQPAADVPIAPITYALDHGEAAQAYCLRADPVHVVADRDVLRMLDPSMVSLVASEAQELIATLNAHFSQDGLQFIAPHPARWYLVLPVDPLLRTHPLAQFAGASLHDYLPFGINGKRWQGYLNEIQMLLHEHPVNNAREARGELPVNSVWFWGGGYLPSLAQKKWAQVWSDAVVALGLAKLSHVPRMGVPADARIWLNATTIPGDHLLVLPAMMSEDLANMEADWFAPLYEALKNRSLQRLTLHLLHGAAYSVDAAALGRWWIRRRPLAQFFNPPL